MPDPLNLGIDFGTSHTVAVLRRADGNVTPLLFDGSPLLPSAVYADASGRLLSGRDAEHSARMDPTRFEPNPKRRIDDGSLLLGDAEIPVTAAFACVLDRVRQECVRVAGTLPPVTLTHPASWGPARRQTLLEAAIAAGFGEPRLVPEPVAAATYFSAVRGHTVPVGSALVVYDLGGGTFDVSVVVNNGNGFDVLTVDGAGDLGGVDFDHALYMYLVGRYDAVEVTRPLTDPRTSVERRQVKAFNEDVRAVKERLSRETSAELHVPFADADVHVTREELETLTAPLLDKAVRLTEVVIRASNVERARIAGVFLVGGASRMPLAATKLHQATGIAPTVLDQPELVVAEGATIGARAAPEVVAPVPAHRVPVAESVSPQATQPPTSVPVSKPEPVGNPRWHKAARTLMWIQAGCGTFFGSVAVYYGPMGLEQGMVTTWNAFAIMVSGALAVVLAAVVGVFAARLGRRTRGTRVAAVAAEWAAVGLGVSSLPIMRAGGQLALVVMFMAYAVPILIMLMRAPARDWFGRH